MLETRSFHVGTRLEQQMIGLLTFALRPYLTRIEQGIKKSLLSTTERMKYFAEFALEGLMRADSSARAALILLLHKTAG